MWLYHDLIYLSIYIRIFSLRFYYLTNKHQLPKYTTVISIIGWSHILKHHLKHHTNRITVAKIKSFSPKQHQPPVFSTTPNGTAGRGLTALVASHDTNAFSCFILFFYFSFKSVSFKFGGFIILHCAIFVIYAFPTVLLSGAMVVSFGADIFFIGFFLFQYPRHFCSDRLIESILSA